ncbi:glycine betaine ABC transporter substrate-binding protein [Calothrix sp. 336/3]|uniref:glycine betaine ABC transporter substrate-binding protein n=1 Tax=Calothrix sp. 336/3 TaxID=1337936 RepID=UPI0004E419C5|nr:glycine betaine ABC transporter substrate-binding protein [Calothrix sp. 336/3]AKG20437.1 glycine/betaine ABC transporter substrate-binding protein [Calothrix sp. 336/3]
MFLISNFSEILLRSGEHLILVAVAIIVAIAIGIPLGILLTRQPRLAPPILGIANALQTIPSLAIFGFLISFPLLGGIGKNPAIVALTLYALLPLIRNTYIGIKNVDPAIREAGKGMGMTDWQLLTQVEIPLASGVILAGVRVATVISVGVATIAAAIGGGGLGVFIFRGISTANNQLIFAGAIPAAVIALGADFLLGLVETQLSQPKSQKIFTQRKFLLAVGIFIAIFLFGVTLAFPQTSPTIIIGSKNFTEQVILGELLAQKIESTTKYKVDRRFNLGGTFICHEAVRTGKIDGYVDYTGTALTAILKQKPINNPQVVYTQVKQAYQDKFKLAVLPSLGFNNTFAIVIRGEDAKRLQIKTLSQAAKYTPQWQAGFGYEFIERADGYPGLAKTYGLKFSKPPQQMELGLMYQALVEKKVDLVAGSSTDGLIPVFKLTILEDDKQYFPPYEAVPIFNQATLEKYPELITIINQLVGKVSADAMQKMNYLVDKQSRPVEQVVSEFLKSQAN